MKKYPKEFFGRCNNYVKDYFVRLDRKNPEKIYVDVAMSQTASTSPPSATAWATPSTTSTNPPPTI